MPNDYYKLFSVIVVLVQSFQLSAQTVRISEIMSLNYSLLADEDGDFSDWLELHNYGDEAVNISGWWLSDDDERPFKWQLPGVLSIDAGAYLLLRASGKDRFGAELHTNFSISGDGESVQLSLPTGLVIDTFPAFNARDDISFGRRLDDFRVFGYFDQPTPGKVNASLAYSGFTDAPFFSVMAGVYPEAFDLSLFASEGATILYTLDGSEPDALSLGGQSYEYRNEYPRAQGAEDGPALFQTIETFEYMAPIEVIDRTSLPSKISAINTQFTAATVVPDGAVRRSMVVRARAIEPGKLPSSIVTNTYFVGSGLSDFEDLAVLAISMDERDLFDFDDGIYVPGRIGVDWRAENLQTNWNPGKPANYAEQGVAFERSGHLEVFESDGSLGLSQQMSVRVHGGWSRGNRVKSLRLYAQGEGSDSNFDYSFFPDLKKNGAPSEPLESFERLILRNSGGFNEWEFTYFRDAFIHHLVKSLPIDQQAFRPAVHFLNGEYWGLINIRERQDARYLSGHYDVDADDVAILESSWTDGMSVEHGVPSDLTQFEEIVVFAESNPMAVEANYDWIRERVDVGNLAIYYAIQIYLNNKDWPDNNNDLWRKRSGTAESASTKGHDGRWRWLLYDTDFGMGGWNFPRGGRPLARVVNLEAGSFRLSGVTANPVNRLFRELVLQNEDFRNMFINMMADQLNSVFREARVESLLQTFEETLSPFRDEHNRRWGTNLRDDPKMHTHALTWPTSQRAQILEVFGLDGTYTLGLKHSDRNAGNLRLNSITLDSTFLAGEETADSDLWEGLYFQGIPIEIEALPSEGYRFAGWQQGDGDEAVLFSEDSTILITPNADFELTPLFEPLSYEGRRFTLHEWSYEEAVEPWSASFTRGGARFEFTPGTGPTALETATGKDFLSEHFRVNEPLGATLVYSMPSEDFGQLQLEFLVRRSRQGAGVVVLEYTIDGSGWFPLEEMQILDDSPQAHLVDLSGLSGVEGNENLAIRFQFQQGGGGVSGNVRFDEIRLAGVALPLTPVDVFPYQSWIAANFPEEDWADPSVVGQDVSNSSDGIPNLIKYALGVSPTESMPALQDLHFEKSALGGFVFRFHIDNRKVDITYILESSSDLVSWDEILFDSSNESPFVPGLPGTYEVQIQRDGSKPKFLRLRIE